VGGEQVWPAGQLAGDCAVLGAGAVPLDEPPPVVGFDPPGPVEVMPLEGVPVPLPVPPLAVPAPGLAVPAPLPAAPPLAPPLAPPPPLEPPPLPPPPLCANTGMARLVSATAAIVVRIAVLMIRSPDFVEKTTPGSNLALHAHGPKGQVSGLPPRSQTATEDRHLLNVSWRVRVVSMGNSS
jgi:hypothetical protein